MTIQYARGNREPWIYLINPGQDTRSMPPVLKTLPSPLQPLAMRKRSTALSHALDLSCRSCRTKIKQRTSPALRMILRTKLLAMDLNQRVMLIQHRRRRLLRCQLHQSALRRPRIRALADETQPLRHSKMMVIHADRTPSQRTEVHHRPAGL